MTGDGEGAFLKRVGLYIGIGAALLAVGAFIHGVSTYISAPHIENVRVVTVGDLKESEASISASLAHLSDNQTLMLENQRRIIAAEDRITASQEHLATVFDTWLRIGVSERNNRSRSMDRSMP